MDRRVTWSELCQAEPQCTKFLVPAVYDILHSPSKLSIWGKVDSPNCPQCPGRGTLEHILTGCQVTLGQGQYMSSHSCSETHHRGHQKNQKQEAIRPHHPGGCLHGGWRAAANNLWSEMYAYRGQLQRVCWAVSLQDHEFNWHYWAGGEESS